MARMIRKQLYLEASQERLLKRLARERKLTEAELVRRAIDGLETTPPSAKAAEAAWQRALEFMRSAPNQAERTRGWSRSELYAERIGRLERILDRH